MTQVLQEKVTEFKLIARNSLRMELINPRLTRIGQLETSIKDVEKEVENQKHDKLVTEYERTKLDKEHPDYEKKDKHKEEHLKHITENLENLKKEKEGYLKQIEEQTEGITKIESGETLVSQDALDNLVNQMVEQTALIQVTKPE